MAVNNNLYPPIVETYMPAFLIDSDTDEDTCRVYFSLSLYNKLLDIKNAQVTVVHQESNASVLNSDKYPCEIMITDIHTDNARQTDDKYYIEIHKEDIEGGKFEINLYYKVQIRFTGASVPNAPTGTKSVDGKVITTQPIDQWLAAYQSQFSEWSTICLVRGISTPTLEVEGFEAGADVTQWESSRVDLIGYLNFKNQEETERLRSYRVKLYDNDGTLLTDSDELYPNEYNNVNSFIYTLKYGLVEGDTYSVTIEYITQNLYQNKKTYKFIVVESTVDILEADLDYVLDEDNGRIGIHIKGKPGTGTFIGNITIRRTSSESNFTLWEDVHTESFGDNTLLDYTWYDYTIESGVWYKYAAQRRSSTGGRGVIIKFKKPIMALFEDMFLTGQDRQLKIEFNPTVSSFKRNVTESNTVTIGSKYPYIKRNGYSYYRSFPISGLISSQMDEDNMFTSKEEIYQSEDTIKLYDEYNDEHRISEYYDFTYEREFRERVEEFLMANKVRLFRSPTEGNILVKLMDVNFQPNQTLGRRLYSFSATAYEIDDYTLENCNKYGIQSLGEYSEHLFFVKNEFGSINEVIPANKDVIEILEEKYKKHAKDGYVIDIPSLDYLRLYIEQPPYLISDGGDAPVPAESRARGISATYLGYIAYINGKPIVINKEGIYELTNDGVQISSLSFPVDTAIDLQYNAHLNETEDTTEVAKVTNFYTKIGQYWGSFGYEDSVYSDLYNKYLERYSKYGQTLTSLDRIKIEAEPYTVVYVKEYDEKEFEKHVIGPTALLDFDNEDSAIVGLYFGGIHFEEANEVEAQRDTLNGFLFKEMNETLDGNTNLDFKKLYRNGVYTLTDDFIANHDNVVAIEPAKLEAAAVTAIDETDNKFKEFINKIINKTAKTNRYIWYNDRWWPFPETNDILCPVEAMIDYTCQVAKGRYEL